MALTTSRFQYLAVRATKEVFWMRDKNCCTVSFSNLTWKNSIRKRISNSGLEPKHSENDAEANCVKQYMPTYKEKEILRLMVNELELAEKVVLNEILKHPKRRFLSVCQIQNSLKFLQDLGYSKQVIADLPAICFYPQGNIKAGLKEMTNNAVELNKLGYVNGFLKDETPGFLCGSKLKDKRLHLCLYYMELPFDFNGNGIFNVDDCSDLNNSETEY